MTPFLTAVEARNKSRSDITIYNEIRDIEFQILQATITGSYDVSVSNTTMTTQTSYYLSWQQTNIDAKLDDQMAAVILNFTNLGYNVARKQNQQNTPYFYWYISW